MRPVSMKSKNVTFLYGSLEFKRRVNGLCQIVKLVELTKYVTLVLCAQFPQAFIKYYSKSSHNAVRLIWSAWQ